MKFEMEKLVDNELARGSEELGMQLAEYICEHYERITNEPQYGRSKIKRLTINVLPDDFELEDKEYTFMEQLMIDNNCKDIWVLWEEDEDNGELEEWWISGDDC